MDAFLNITKNGPGGQQGRQQQQAAAGRLPDLSSLLGEEFKGKDMKQLAQQAESLWKFLDDMADTDEDGYRKFIEQQAAAAAEASKAEHKAGGGDAAQAAMLDLVGTAAPLMAVEVKVKDSPPPGVLAVIQILSAKEGANVPAATVGTATPTPLSPTTTTWDGLCVPMLQCRPPFQPPLQPPPHPGPGPKGASIHPPNPTPSPRPVRFYFVAISAATAALALQDSPTELRLLLAAAACQFVEAKHSLRLERETWRVRMNAGLLPEAERSRLDAEWRAAAASQAVQGTAAEDLPQSLLFKLSNLGSSGPTVGQAPSSNRGPAAAGAGAEGQRDLASSLRAKPTAAAKGPLIVEMDTPATFPAPAPAPAAAADAAPQALAPAAPGPTETPQVSVISAAEGQERHVLLQVHLPSVSKASEVDIEVLQAGGGPGHVLLHVAGAGPLRFDLPAEVDDERAKAKFDTKKKVLSVRFPLRNGQM